MRPPANRIARKVSPDVTLNRVEHTLPYVGGKTVVTVGHKNVKVTQLSNKTVRSHVTWELHGLMHSGKAKNGLDRG